MYAWACVPCQKARIADGWTVKKHKVVAWGCDDCERVRQLAPGYATPTADFVPTSPESFCPAPGWKPDAPIKPWPRAEARKKSWQRVENEILKPIEGGGR